jgi:hypothetical protein
VLYRGTSVLVREHLGVDEEPVIGGKYTLVYEDEEGDRPGAGRRRPMGVIKSERDQMSLAYLFASVTRCRFYGILTSLLRRRMFVATAKRLQC